MPISQANVGDVKSNKISVTVFDVRTVERQTGCNASHYYRFVEADVDSTVSTTDPPVIEVVTTSAVGSNPPTISVTQEEQFDPNADPMWAGAAGSVKLVSLNTDIITFTYGNTSPSDADDYDGEVTLTTTSDGTAATAALAAAAGGNVLVTGRGIARVETAVGKGHDLILKWTLQCDWLQGRRGITSG